MLYKILIAFCASAIAIIPLMTEVTLKEGNLRWFDRIPLAGWWIIGLLVCTFILTIVDYVITQKNESEANSSIDAKDLEIRKLISDLKNEQQGVQIKISENNKEILEAIKERGFEYDPDSKKLVQNIRLQQNITGISSYGDGNKFEGNSLTVTGAENLPPARPMTKEEIFTEHLKGKVINFGQKNKLDFRNIIVRPVNGTNYSKNLDASETVLRQARIKFEIGPPVASDKINATGFHIYEYNGKLVVTIGN
ncbi:MAG: hypothetical protein EOO93_25940 [Pedobacter sp.]|nr:MAG: hypothetical protein EOO93_25940 [Pedobacter sp.]